VSEPPISAVNRLADNASPSIPFNKGLGCGWDRITKLAQKTDVIGTIALNSDCIVQQLVTGITDVRHRPSDNHSGWFFHITKMAPC
jgi:hypothetical protein